VFGKHYFKDSTDNKLNCYFSFIGRQKEYIGCLYEKNIYVFVLLLHNKKNYIQNNNFAL